MRWRWSLLLVALSACSASAHVAPPAHLQPAAREQAQEATDGRAAAPSVALVPIPNARAPLPGVVTGGVPSDENLSAAQALGYKTVVSLLPAAEAGDEAERVGRYGLRFVSIPVAGPDDLTEANARRLGEVLQDAAQRPLILHCASGNRSGALLALEASYVEHMPPERALELGLSAGLSKLRPVVEERLGITSAASP